MKLRTVSFGAVFALLALAVYECWFTFDGIAQNQRPPGQQPAPPPTLGLDQGYLDLDSPDFFVKLVKASQTVAALRLLAGDAFKRARAVAGRGAGYADAIRGLSTAG